MIFYLGQSQSKNGNGDAVASALNQANILRQSRQRKQSFLVGSISIVIAPIMTIRNALLYYSKMKNLQLANLGIAIKR